MPPPALFRRYALTDSGISTVVVSASATQPGQVSGQFTITVNPAPVVVVPTGPATLTITSFTCITTNAVLTGVDFVIGYSDGSFAPAVPNLFLNGLTITGQLGQLFTLNFDANQSILPIADNATRQVYFNWNYRQACATTPVSPPVTPPVGNPPVATALSNQTATVGTAFSYAVPSFGGTAPVVYAATGLPQSLSFDATTRTISGTPSVTAVATVVVSASNAAGQVSGQFTLTVNPAPVVAPQPVAPRRWL